MNSRHCSILVHHHLPRRNPRSPRLLKRGQCALNSDAIVIGGGIAGLLSAHVLSRHLESVILIDKDDVNTGRVQHETFSEVSSS